jgi:hypothetical protein
MRYKSAPRLEYHHIQPLVIVPPPHSPGDLNLRAMRERRRLQPVPKPQRPASRPCIITIFAIPGPEPEPEPEPITVPTPFGAIVIDPTPRSPVEEAARLMPIIAITQAVARPRAGGGLRHMIRCWVNNLFGGR